MVKKLMKYDLTALLRTLLPIELIVLATALFTRIVLFFESDTIPYRIVSVSSTVFYVISILVAIVMTSALCIIRFYKNLYTGEGYLTFTLPVTQRQIILSKLLSAMVVTLLTAVTVLVSVAVVSAGEMLVEEWKAAAYLLKQYFKTTGVNGAFFMIEGLLGLILMPAYAYLLFYACISIGQLAKKNRILAAFGVYFLYYFITQVFGTVFLLLNVATDFELVKWITDSLSKHPYPAVHCLAWATILFTAVFCGIYYLISHTVMKKKLNLE